MKILWFCILMSILIAAAPKGIAREKPYGFQFTTKQRRVCIPFQYRSNLIIIPVCLNDRDSAHFIVDTGVSHTIITNSKAFRKNSFTISRTLKLAGVGEGETLTASIAIGNSLGVGSLRIEQHTVVLMHEDILNLSEYAGMAIHGIIGYDLFADLVVTIDFNDKFFSLLNLKTIDIGLEKGERCPLTIQDKKPYTDALTVSNGMAAQRVRILIDTGAGQALLLDRFHREVCPVPVPGNRIRIPLGRGLTGPIHGDLGRLARLSLGKFELDNVLVAYPDSAEFGMKLHQLPVRQGNLGCELLRRFQVTFNYSGGYMVLKPVKHTFREPFEHDMSGLEFRARGETYDQYYISQVVRNSPADQAGLQVGDELVAVNGTPAQNLGMAAIYQLLLVREGASVTVVVQRQHQVISRRFVLKRLI